MRFEDRLEPIAAIAILLIFSAYAALAEPAQTLNSEGEIAIQFWGEDNQDIQTLNNCVLEFIEPQATQCPAPDSAQRVSVRYDLRDFAYHQRDLLSALLTGSRHSSRPIVVSARPGMQGHWMVFQYTNEHAQRLREADRALEKAATRHAVEIGEMGIEAHARAFRTVFGDDISDVPPGLTVTERCDGQVTASTFEFLGPSLTITKGEPADLFRRIEEHVREHCPPE